MKIEKRILGIAQTNTYYLHFENKTIVVDPCVDSGYDARRLLKPLEGKNVVGILITHGHFDHISGIDAIVDIHKCPVYMFHEEIHWLKNPQKNLSFQFGEPITVESPITSIKLGNLDVDGVAFQVIKTPGHTAGSVSYVYRDAIIDGDFIMNMGVGRTDLPTGNMAALTEAMRHFKKMYQNKNYVLYPGHGDVCFFDEECKYNPYLKNL